MGRAMYRNTTAPRRGPVYPCDSAMHRLVRTTGAVRAALVLLGGLSAPWTVDASHVLSRHSLEQREDHGSTDRIPAPSMEVRTEIQELIRERWAPEFKKATARRRLALADELAREASEEQDTAIRYVLALEELALCIKAGAVRRALEVGRRLDMAYDSSGGEAAFAAQLARQLRAGRETATFDRLAELEFQGADDPPQWLALGRAWDAARSHASKSRRLLPAERAREALLRVVRVVAPESEVHSEAVELLRPSEREVEAADARAQRYRLFEGRWVVTDRAGAFWEIEVDGAGYLRCREQFGPDATRVVHDEVTSDLGRLRRRSRVVMGRLPPDGSLCRFWIDGDRLFVARKGDRGKGRADADAAYRGEWDREPRGAAINLARARRALELGDGAASLEAVAIALDAAPSSHALRTEGPALAVSAGVLDYALRSLGSKVGDGECWTLADEALKHARAGRPAGGAGFGRVLESEELLRPGDVLQFEGARFEAESGKWLSMPHHTAVVGRVMEGRCVELLHQNFGRDGKSVSRLVLDLDALSRGTVDCYRPIPSSTPR